MWPPERMHQLMRRIKKYKRLVDDRLQGKGKASVTSQYRKEYRHDRIQPRATWDPKALVEDQG